MEKKIPPLWEVKEICQGKQVHSYGFQVETEQEARALYGRSYRAYPESTLEARRVDGILAKNARYFSWLNWRGRLDWVAILLGLLGAMLSVFPSITLDIQMAGISIICQDNCVICQIMCHAAKRLERMLSATYLGVTSLRRSIWLDVLFNSPIRKTSAMLYGKFSSFIPWDIMSICPFL